MTCWGLRRGVPSTRHLRTRPASRTRTLTIASASITWLSLQDEPELSTAIARRSIPLEQAPQVHLAYPGPVALALML